MSGLHFSPNLHSSKSMSVCQKSWCRESCLFSLVSKIHFLPTYVASAFSTDCIYVQYISLAKTTTSFLNLLINISIGRTACLSSLASKMGIDHAYVGFAFLTHCISQNLYLHARNLMRKIHVWFLWYPKSTSTAGDVWSGFSKDCIYVSNTLFSLYINCFPRLSKSTLMLLMFAFLDHKIQTVSADVGSALLTAHIYTQNLFSHQINHVFFSC